jgi:hypothetical protein
MRMSKTRDACFHDSSCKTTFAISSSFLKLRWAWEPLSAHPYSHNRGGQAGVLAPIVLSKTGRTHLRQRPSPGTHCSSPCFGVWWVSPMLRRCAKPSKLRSVIYADSRNRRFNPFGSKRMHECEVHAAWPISNVGLALYPVDVHLQCHRSDL